MTVKWEKSSEGDFKKYHIYHANIDDFEQIIVNGKSGETLKMYRKKKERIDKEDLENFTSSWTAFQQNLTYNQKESDFYKMFLISLILLRH